MFSVCRMKGPVSAILIFNCIQQVYETSLVLTVHKKLLFHCNYSFFILPYTEPYVCSNKLMVNKTMFYIYSEECCVFFHGTCPFY
jgi:hypothetical protein